MDITEQIATLSNSVPQLTPVFVHGSSKRQNFALPKFTMDYILKNPKSHELWKKLIQTCKWFFDKNPIVVLPCLHCTDDDDDVVITTCSGGYCDDLCDRPVNFIFKQFMLWITHQFDMKKECSIDAAKFLIPYIYKCDATAIRLVKQVLTFEEFLFLTDKVVHLIYAPGLQTGDNIPVPFEKIVESLPNIKNIF
uniref:Uncharacterized protein n=1 Tax=Panagrolaimus davidi TaxID=227884 RepID=A0A914Q5N5_9BILA